MKQQNVVMRINCDECEKRYAIKEDELDEYNIYWVMTKKGLMPKLLCPVCTKKWTAKIKKES